MKFIKKIKPYKLITLCFLLCGLIGGLLLFSPLTHQNGIKVSLVDSFFTAISALCVTGLSTLDIANTFNLFGRIVIALLIQLGGLGIVCVALSIIIFAGQKIGIRQRILIKESLNMSSLKGIVKFVLTILKITLSIEGVGAILFFFVFIHDFPPLKALEVSIFHSISSFNNAGFDIIGNFQNMMPYNNNILLNLTTCVLIVLGGLGFLVIKDILEKKNLRKLSLHSKVVIFTSFFLIVGGTLIIKFSENISWLESLFISISSRTAGFNTVPLTTFSKVGIFTLLLLMFVGASPSSTGGGIKTTTLYTLIKGTSSICQNKQCGGFRRKLSEKIINRAFIVLFIGLIIVCSSTMLLCIFEPHISFTKLLFEAVSAFGTVGLSLDITPSLSFISKIIIMITMFIGRVGPITLLLLWTRKGMEHVSYPEENIVIG